MATPDQLKYVKPGDRPSASQWNLMVQLLKREVTGPNMFRDNTGWHFRKAPGGPTAKRPDEVVSYTYTKRFHAYQYGLLNDHEVFWANPDCYNSFIHVYAEVRECDGDGLAGDHPAYQGYVYNGKYQGTSIVCGSAGHDNWVSLPNTIVYKTRITPDVEQEAQGRADVEAPHATIGRAHGHYARKSPLCRC